MVLATWKDNGIRARGNFDIIMFSASTGLDPQAHLSTRFHSSQIPTEANGNSGFNFNCLQDPNIDRWLEAAATEPDTARRAELYRQVSQRLNEHVANIWLYARSSRDAARTTIIGPAADPWNFITSNTADWHLAEEREQSMQRYLARRLLRAVPLLLISLLLFGVMRFVPGGPLAAYKQAPDVRPEDMAESERPLGLDQLLPVQHLAWLGK